MFKVNNKYNRTTFWCDVLNDVLCVLIVAYCYINSYKKNQNFSGGEGGVIPTLLLSTAFKLNKDFD